MTPVEIVIGNVSPVEEFLIRAGAIATALAAVVTALLIAIRYLIVRPLDAKLAARDHALEERIAGVIGDELGARIQRLDDQLHSNGGASLRDQTNRIEAALKEHIADERDRTRVLAIELRTTNQRLERLAESHRHRKEDD